MKNKLLLFAVYVLIFTASTVFAQELRVGTTLALSGPYGFYGKHALYGIQLAVDEINASGGAGGRPVKLIVEDTGTLDLKRAATAAQKLIVSDKVELLLPLIIEDSEVIVPLTSRIPMFSMAVGCGARKCGFNLGPYHVRASASHDRIAEKLVDYARSRKIKHVCVIAAESTYFEAYGRLIEELSNKAGQKVTYAAVPLSNTDDFREVALRFNQSGCEAIYTWIPMGAVGGFFRRVREIGSQALILSIVESDDPGVLRNAGEAAEGVVFARFSTGTPELSERFVKKFGEAPARPAIPAYDGVKLLLQIAGKVGTGAAKIREAILKVNGAPASNGTMTYTADGERLGEDVELMRIENGAAVRVD